MFIESKLFPLKAFQVYIQQPCNYVNLSGTVRSQDQWNNRSQVQTWPGPVNFSQRAASSMAQGASPRLLRDLFGFLVHKRMEYIKFKPLSQEIHLNWMAGTSFVSQWVKLNNIHTLEGRELLFFFNLCIWAHVINKAGYLYHVISFEWV